MTPSGGSPPRIIPACAGSTMALNNTTNAQRDHPRMRGEHRRSLLSRSPRMGSSPHARGAPRGVRQRHVPAGIIPACAGSTPTPPKSASCARDHPRMRGEHTLHALMQRATTGSSPHARGAHRHQIVDAWVAGIIPACAGSTRLRSHRMGTYGDHPRMRGEHALLQSPMKPTVGSSPHARGARERRRAAHKRPGIIPACAGSTGVAQSDRHVL